MPDTLGMFPFWKVKFDKDANPVDPAAIDTFVSEVKSQGVTDLFIFSHGWNNDESAAAWLYQSFFGEVAKLMANPAVAKKNPAAKIGVVGIVWPSILWPDDAPSSGPAPELPAPSGGGTVSMNATAAGVTSKTATIPEVKSALQSAYGTDAKQQTLINDLTALLDVAAGRRRRHQHLQDEARRVARQRRRCHRRQPSRRRRGGSHGAERQEMA